MSNPEFEKIVKLFQNKNLSDESVLENLNIIKKIFNDENNGYILDYYKETYHKKIYQNFIYKYKKFDVEDIQNLNNDIFEIIA
jgi:hypothetical protein